MGLVTEDWSKRYGRAARLGKPSRPKTRIKGHFVDGGYLSVAIKQQVAREHGVGLVGPIRARSTRQSRKGNVFHREDFTINWDAKQFIC
ncbi:hypothetical protein M877_28365 [Streptomyces niveus NCIMB 11891]|nr:hypothetical protein M877_28365 [Streptomyces niveus NCIMB 11891]